MAQPTTIKTKQLTTKRKKVTMVQALQVQGKKRLKKRL